MIGRSIGRFRVLAALGQGGMASVWRARDELLGREIALKILADSLSQSEDARRRFRHEAGIAARLDHPGIAAVYDSGETDGLTWIAMALIDGETLAERVRRSLLPIADAVRVGVVAAEALGYAHGQGIVHRDVSSRNIMLARDGRVFVLDFGLALAQGASRVSSSGTTVGTAPYMAPEVLLGRTADPRSDLYSLGTVLYEALTGALPYKAATAAATIFATLHQEIRPPRELRPEIGAALECVVLRCLARDPAQRFAAAGEVAAGLREGLRSDVGAGPAPGVAGSATPRRSVTAERLAQGEGLVYLAIPPFECLDHGAEGDARSAGLCDSITTAARVGLSQLERTHVVPAETSPIARSNDSLREYARGLGANLLLLGSVRRSTTRLRVSYAVVDPEASLQVAGDTVEGSALDAFELEDRLVASLRRALVRAGAIDSGAERTRPSDPAAAERFQQALRYLERHDHEASVDGAIGILERLLESEGERAEYHALLARAFLLKYQLTRQHTWSARAASACERAATLDADLPEVQVALGDLHASGGRLDEARAAYERALDRDPSRFEAALGLAMVLDGMGRRAESETACDRAIALRPSDWRAHSIRGLIAFTHGQYERAAECWQRVIQITPDNATGMRNLGSALYHLDRLEDSIGAYRRSLEIQPNAVAYTNLGTVLFFLRRYEEAVPVFEKSTALMPADPIKWGNLGAACLLIPGLEVRGRHALERAIGLMRERLDREAGTADTWSRLAEWHSGLDQHAEATSCVRRALELGPDDVQALVRAAWVHLKVGDANACLHWLGEAVARGYSVEELLRHREIDAVRDRPEFQRLLQQGVRKPLAKEVQPDSPQQEAE